MTTRLSAIFLPQLFCKYHQHQIKLQKSLIIIKSFLPSPKHQCRVDLEDRQYHCHGDPTTQHTGHISQSRRPNAEYLDFSFPDQLPAIVEDCEMGNSRRRSVRSGGSYGFPSYRQKRRTSRTTPYGIYSKAGQRCHSDCPTSRNGGQCLSGISSKTARCALAHDASLRWPWLDAVLTV
jgi:hypothetical protein